MLSLPLVVSTHWNHREEEAKKTNMKCHGEVLTRHEQPEMHQCASACILQVTETEHYSCRRYSLMKMTMVQSAVWHVDPNSLSSDLEGHDPTKRFPFVTFLPSFIQVVQLGGLTDALNSFRSCKFLQLLNEALPRSAAAKPLATWITTGTPGEVVCTRGRLLFMSSYLCSCSMAASYDALCVFVLVAPFNLVWPLQLMKGRPGRVSAYRLLIRVLHHCERDKCKRKRKPLTMPSFN